MLKGAQSLGMIATTYGEAGKITFLGAHYAGGPDLIALAGSAAENYYWTTSYKLMTAKGPGTDAQLALAKRYGRDDKLANHSNYTNGIMVVQVAVEAMRRAKAKRQKNYPCNPVRRNAGHERLQRLLPADHRRSGHLFENRPRGCGHAAALRCQGRCVP